MANESEIIPGSINDTVYLKARQIYETFYHLLRQRSGTPSGVPVARQRSFEYFQKTFYEVAKMCHERGWDPATYTRHVLDSIHKSQRYITPKDLLAHQVIQQYELMERSNHNIYNPAVMFDLQVGELLNYMQSNGVSEATVLRSAMLPFEAWFRVLYPERIDDFTMDIFGRSARQELAESRELRTFARQRFPRTFEELENRFGRFGDIIEEKKP